MKVKTGIFSFFKGFTGIIYWFLKMLPEDLQDLEAETGSCCTICLCLLPASVMRAPGHEMCSWNARIRIMWENTLTIRGKKEV